MHVDAIMAEADRLAVERGTKWLFVDFPGGNTEWTFRCLARMEDGTDVPFSVPMHLIHPERAVNPPPAA